MSDCVTWSHREVESGSKRVIEYRYEAGSDREIDPGIGLMMQDRDYSSSRVDIANQAGWNPDS